MAHVGQELTFQAVGVLHADEEFLDLCFLKLNPGLLDTKLIGPPPHSLFEPALPPYQGARAKGDNKHGDGRNPSEGSEPEPPILPPALFGVRCEVRPGRAPRVEEIVASSEFETLRA